jgi:putative tryptophan/tyrosine transport system substrate-binding protein
VIARLAAILLAAGATLGASAVAVTATTVEAYRQTYEGLREQFPEMQLIDLRNEEALKSWLAGSANSVAIAIGAEAASVLDRLAPPDTLLVNTVMMDYDADRANGQRQRPKSTILVDLPPARLMEQLLLLFPGRTRIGLIRGPTQTDSYVAAFTEAAKQAGYSVETVACNDPRDLVELFLRLKSRVDFVWCPPSAHLYTSATVKPLLIASLTNRLPVVVYSEQFVQAGALFGGGPDFRDVGRQTAALVQKILRGEPVPPRIAGRRFQFFYNQRVARLLGVKASSAETGAANLTVLK